MMTANAATAIRYDGELGPDSAAFFDITLTTAAQARVWGLEDIVLKRESDGSVNDVTPAENFCVFSNNVEGSNKFTLTISSSNNADGKPFQLIDQTGANSTAVGYTISVNDGTTTLEGNSTAGSSGSVSKLLDAGLLSAQPNPAVNCTGGQMSLTVGVPTTVPAAAGSYSDTITMTVAPE